jgi:SAM-dependent methyltransferase
MSYATLARYYDLENAEFTEDLDFWIELAETHSGPILELGCGTGRVLLNLARRGHAVTGVDNSPEMLARLRAKLEAASERHLPAAPAIVQAGMEDFELPERFGLTLVPYNTFMHLQTQQAQLDALARIRRHMRPGGTLALDVVNAAEAYAAQEQALTLERSFMDGERTVQQFASIALDRAGQTARVTWIYDSTGPDGSVQRTIVPLTLRYCFAAEMGLLLAHSGFSLTQLFGDYDRSPYEDGASRMLVMAQAA